MSSNNLVPSIIINQELCDKEGLCVKVCLAGVFEKADADSYPVVAHPEECYTCGHCVAVCPGNAIDHGGLTMENFPPIGDEMTIEPQRLQGFLRKRRSMRRYNQKRIVPRKLIGKMLEAGRYAPTGTNAQSLEHIVVTDPEVRKSLVAHTIDVFRQEFDSLQEKLARDDVDPLDASRAESDLQSFKRVVADYEAGDDPIFYKAPVVIITHAKRASTATPLEDATLASFQMMLMAESLGLGTCYIGYFYEVTNQSIEIRNLLGIPEKNDILMSFIAGYPAVRFSRLVDRNPLSVRWFTP